MVIDSINTTVGNLRLVSTGSLDINDDSYRELFRIQLKGKKLEQFYAKNDKEAKNAFQKFFKIYPQKATHVDLKNEQFVFSLTKGWGRVVGKFNGLIEDDHLVSINDDERLSNVKDKIIELIQGDDKTNMELACEMVCQLCKEDKSEE